MKYEIRKVDKEKGIICITTTDERYYQHGETFVPSSTWIADHYPKGIAFYKWLADKGWNEAESLKSAAGNKGSRVHHAIEMLLKGEELKFDDVLPDEKEEQKELTVEEWECIMSFKAWHDEAKPKVLLVERSAINFEYCYGGTIDLVCEIDGQVYVVDFKTSANIWKSHELQISSYARLLPFIDETTALDARLVKTAILQLGYGRNKKGFKFTEIDDKFELFLHAKAIWAEENADKQPAQRLYPLTIKL